MFRSLRPHAVVAAYLAARPPKPGADMYALNPFHPVAQLRRRVARKDPLGAAADAMGLYPFTPPDRRAPLSLPSWPSMAGQGELMTSLNQEPAVTVHVISVGEHVRSFALRIESVREQNPSSVDEHWARFLDIARQDPAVQKVTVVHSTHGPRDGKAPR